MDVFVSSLAPRLQAFYLSAGQKDLHWTPGLSEMAVKYHAWLSACDLQPHPRQENSSCVLRLLLSECPHRGQVRLLFLPLVQRPIKVFGRMIYYWIFGNDFMSNASALAYNTRRPLSGHL